MLQSAALRPVADTRSRGVTPTLITAQHQMAATS